MRQLAKSLIFILVIVSTLGGATSLAMAAPDTPETSTRLTGGFVAVEEAVYWELVKRSRAEVIDLKGQSEQEITEVLARLANEWESITEVQSADGQFIPVDNGYLLEALRADKPQLEKIISLIEVLQDAHDENPGQVFSTADLDPLYTILARPEFAWPEDQPNPINEWFQKIWERVNQWLNSVLGGLQLNISIDSTLLPIIAAILLAVILFFIFNTVFADFVRDARITADKNGGNEPLTAESAFDRAQSLSRGGDYRSAVRYLYLSSLLALDERGLLRYDRSKTNREYLRSISDSPELSEPLEDVISVFDDVWYGYHSLEEKSFQHYSDRVRELKEKKG